MSKMNEIDSKYGISKAASDARMVAAGMLGCFDFDAIEKTLDDFLAYGVPMTASADAFSTLLGEYIAKLEAIRAEFQALAQ